ncbi:MAG: NAD-dependent epimerase/dehydratase family protein [Proteobacteria bacterium]|nr:NAD-dependent epimerase/dehydratase family protein [Pseudomonadota bacterium]
MRVLVTGARGFVGSTLCAMLTEGGYDVRTVSRSDVGEIDGTTDWSAALRGVEYVVHLAARVHVLHDPNSALYAQTNAEGTRRLAESAAHAGVRRLVFVSSIKVNGEETTGRAYTAADKPNPMDAYGESKLLGEQCLLRVAEQSSLEAAIVRPPLVYGVGVRANFLRLMALVDRGLPLPLGSVRNRRSLVNVWNLSDFLVTLLSHPAAAGRTWLVSDGEDLSTAELVRKIARALDRPARLLPVPVGLLSLAAQLAGRKAELSRLLGSLVVDSSPAHRELGWVPPVAIDAALARTAAWYRSQ